MAALGDLIHLLQDATSPAHEKFQDYGTQRHWKGHINLERCYPGSGTKEGDYYRKRLEAATQWALDLKNGKAEMPANIFDKDGALMIPERYLRD